MVWAIAGTLVLALVAAYNPTTTRVFPPCPFHFLTGLYCPGCGTLRSLHLLLHGDLGAALRYNPLAVVAIPPVAYGLLSQVLEVTRGRGLPRLARWHGWGWVLLGVVLVYWVLRNIPAWPFRLLAPP